MEGEDVNESIKIMCQTILKNSNSMNKLIKSSLDKVKKEIEIINEKESISDNDIRLIKEINRLINSISMYEWLLLNKVEVIEELIKCI